MSPAERLEAHRRGENPRLVARMASGFLEMAPFQFRRGYCLLLADPFVPSLDRLSPEDAVRFLADCDRAARAIIAETGAVRVNLSIYGNLDPFLHAHLIPRFADEPEAEATVPPMSLPLTVRESCAWSADAHSELMDRLRLRL